MATAGEYLESIITTADELKRLVDSELDGELEINKRLAKVDNDLNEILDDLVDGI